MGLSPLIAAVLALGGAVSVWIADRAGELPWPHIATRSLVGLFILAAVTRVAADAGVRAQRHARYVVAGVALTASGWYLLSGMLALGALHLAAAWLAAARDRRGHGMALTAITVMSVSLLAHAALGAAPVAGWLAGFAIVAGWMIAGERRGAAVAAGIVAAVTLVLATNLGRTGDPLALTMIAGAAPLVLGAARSLRATSSPAGSRSPRAAR